MSHSVRFQRKFLRRCCKSPCSCLTVKNIQSTHRACIFLGCKRLAWSRPHSQFDCVQMWLFSDSVPGCQSPASALPLLSTNEGFSPEWYGQINQINKHYGRNIISDVATTAGTVGTYNACLGCLYLKQLLCGLHRMLFKTKLDYIVLFANITISLVGVW